MQCRISGEVESILLGFRSIVEPHELLVESQRNLSGRTVPLFGDNKFRLAPFAFPILVVVGVDFRSHEETDEISILLDRTRFPKIAHAGFSTP